MPTASEVACNNFLNDLTKISKLHKVEIESTKGELCLYHLSAKHNYNTGKYIADCDREFPERSRNVRWVNE